MASRASLDGLLSCCPVGASTHAIKTTPSTPSARERPSCAASTPSTRGRARRHRYRNAGLMSYEELKKVLRTGYPGLKCTDQVTDNQIRGLWRGLDDDLSGEVSYKNS